MFNRLKKIFKRINIIIILFIAFIITSCGEVMDKMAGRSTATPFGIQLSNPRPGIWEEVTVQVIVNNPYNHQLEYRFVADRGKILASNDLTSPVVKYYAPFTGGDDTIRVTIRDRNDNINLAPLSQTFTVYGESVVYVELPEGTSSLKDTENGKIKIASLVGTFQNKDLAIGRNPTISPDGRYVAYTYYPGDGTSQIYIKDPLGTQTNLTQNHKSFNTEPTWSPIFPDGKLHLAFASDRLSTVTGSSVEGRGQYFHIWRMNIIDRTAIQITNTAGNDRQPSWSPVNGNSIVFSSDFDSNKANNFRNLWEIDIQRGNLRQLTHEKVTDKGAFEPSWSPDGTKIAYTRKYLQRAMQSGTAPLENFQKIWLIDINLFNTTSDIGFGFPASRQVDVGVIESSPTWSPDGRKITYTQLRGTESNVVSIETNQIPRDTRGFGPIMNPFPENLSRAIEIKWANQAKIFSNPYGYGGGYGSGYGYGGGYGSGTGYPPGTTYLSIIK